MQLGVKARVTISTEFTHYVFARNWNTYLSAVNPLNKNKTDYTWAATKTAEYTILQANVYKVYEDVYRKLGIRPGNGEMCNCNDINKIIVWGNALVANL